MRCFDSEVSRNPLALFQRPRRDIFAVVGALKADLRASLIGALHRRLQLRCPRRYSEHAASRSIESLVAFGSAGVEDLYAVQLRCILQTGNILARLVAPRITARSHHYAHRRI